MHRILPPTAALVLALLGLSLLPLTGTAVPHPGEDRANAACQEPSEDQLVMSELREAIAAKELLIALQLEDVQQDQLHAALSEARELRDTTREEAERRKAASATALLPILKDYQRELETHGEVSEETRARLSDLRSEFRPKRGEAHRARRGIREAIAGILSEEQQEALRNFRPLRGSEMDPSRRDLGNHHRDRSMGRDGGPGPGGKKGSGPNGRGRMARLLLSDAFLNGLSASK